MKEISFYDHNSLEYIQLLVEAQRRYDRKIQVNGGQSWYEWIVDWLDMVL